LAVRVGPVGGAFGAGTNIRVPLCSVGGPINLAGKKIHYRAKFETAAGFSPLDSSAGDFARVSPNAYNGSMQVYAPNEDLYVTPEGGGWMTLDFTVPANDPTAVAVTHFGLAIAGQRTVSTEQWSGIFYIDDIQIQ
jgi:hypothetical protein